jgi:flagellin-like protein
VDRGLGLTLTERRAISEILATILVVAMTILGAGILYTYFDTVVSRAQVTAQVSVTANLAVPSGVGQGTVAITVTNSGSVAMTDVSLSGSIVPSTVNWNPAPSPSNPIPPSGGTSAAVFPTAKNVVAGVSYSMVLVVTYANGATSSQVITVTATT